jgi:hypothetical protein
MVAFFTLVHFRNIVNNNFPITDKKKTEKKMERTLYIKLNSLYFKRNILEILI